MMRETIRSVSAFGDSMTLEVVDHGEDGSSKEFIIAAPKFNFKKWLLLTLFLSSLSVTWEIYIVDLRLLGLILSILCLALILKLHKKIKLESLLVVSSLGLQHTTLYASGRRETFFLSRRRLKSVLIVEGITMNKVLFYLAIVLNPHGPSTRLAFPSMPSFSSSSNSRTIKEEKDVNVIRHKEENDDMIRLKEENNVDVIRDKEEKDEVIRDKEGKDEVIRDKEQKDEAIRDKEESEDVIRSNGFVSPAPDDQRRKRRFIEGSSPNDARTTVKYRDSVNGGGGDGGGGDGGGGDGGGGDDDDAASASASVTNDAFAAPSTTAPFAAPSTTATTTPAAASSATSTVTSSRPGNSVVVDPSSLDVRSPGGDDLRISNEDTVYPLFQSLWPRLDVLTVIYRGVEKTLFQRRGDEESCVVDSMEWDRR